MIANIKLCVMVAGGWWSVMAVTQQQNDKYDIMTIALIIEGLVSPSKNSRLFYNLVVFANAL